ncbi:hypothetical protein [Cellulophaga baltica]|uniref:hypothetical protein n=1 Tax=Cellulophaga baltica TaxID=76594 RepID=UPI000427C57F|nr:hypothetical protein [Cellulophaga baltica]
MKNKLIIIALVIGLFTACNRDEYDAPNSLSDVSWYTSGFRDTIIRVNVDNFASFSDLSQGALSHKWTIEEGSFYLKGPITRSDTIFDDFKIQPESLESEDETVHVLFTKGGLKKVNLYNEFSEYVEFKGADGFIFPSKEVAGKWVIDTTFIVDVYDTIVPKILIRQNGIVVPHESETDEIIVEAGSTLEFVDVSTIGRPNTRSWSIAGVTKTDSLSVIQFNKLGSYKGNLNISRQGESLPGDYDNYKIPATITVIPSSLPFEVAGEVVELENQTIQIPYNGEFAPFSDQSSHFTVTVNGTPFTIASIGVNASNATLLEIKLQEQIYRSDVITVSYDGSGDFESTDTRIPGAFSNLPVIMHNVNLLSADIAGFEKSEFWMARADNEGTFEITTEQFTSGTSSLKLVLKPGQTSTNVEGILAANELTLDPDKEYTISYNLYLAPGAIGTGTARTQIGLFFLPDNLQFFDATIRTMATGVWTQSIKINYKPNTANVTNMYFRFLGLVDKSTDATIYIDDLHIVETEVRP